MRRDPKAVAALAAAIRHLIDIRISRDQGLIGAHERASDAQQNLVDALKRFAGMTVEESVEP
jgi:hypothetical protein